MDLKKLISFILRKTQIEKIFHIQTGRNEGFAWITSQRLPWRIFRKAYSVHHTDFAWSFFRGRVAQTSTGVRVVYNMSAALNIFSDFVRGEEFIELEGFGDIPFEITADKKNVRHIHGFYRWEEQEYKPEIIKAKDIPAGTKLDRSATDFFSLWKGRSAVSTSNILRVGVVNSNQPA